MDKNIYPSIFSFMTYRIERFGALAFNPYIGSEVELNQKEAFVISQCTGRNTIDVIEKSLSDVYGLSLEKSVKFVEATIEKMIDHYSMKLFSKPVNIANIDDVMPLLNEDGPYYIAPKSVVWNITHLCNLNCKHCLTSSGKRSENELNLDQAKRLIDHLAEAKILNLSLSGGEPLLHPDIIEILDYACNTNMRIDIATNGVNIKEDVLEALCRLPIFQVQVSIDGLEALHDEFRGKQGAFKSACDNIKLLIENDIAVSVSTTVTKENLSMLEDIINLSYELGCSGFKAIPLMSVGRGAINEPLALSKADHKQMHQILMQYSEQYQFRMNISSEGGFYCLLENSPPKEQHSHLDGPMGCSAGYDTLSIGVDGTAYPCPFLQDFPIGNLLEENMNEVWQKSEVLNRLRTITKKEMDEPCQNCAYAPEQCRGGCRAAAYLANGHLLASDPHCFKSVLETV